MGLDTVELILAVESEFGIDIPDEDAARLTTPGALSDYIGQRLRSCGVSPVPNEDEIWHKVKSLVVKHLGVKPTVVTHDAQFVRDLGAD